MIRSTTAFLFAVLLWTAPAAAQVLELFVEATTCYGSVTLPPFTLVHGGIRAIPARGGGVLGAEFSIQGLPSNQVLAMWTPASEAVVSGDPFAAGARVAFSQCKTDPSGVTLFDVTLFAMTTAPFRSVTFQPLQDSARTCPVVFGCDGVAACASGWVVSHPGPPGAPSPADQATGVALAPT